MADTASGYAQGLCCFACGQVVCNHAGKYSFGDTFDASRGGAFSFAVTGASLGGMNALLFSVLLLVGQDPETGSPAERLAAVAAGTQNTRPTILQARLAEITGQSRKLDRSDPDQRKEFSRLKALYRKLETGKLTARPSFYRQGSIGFIHQEVTIDELAEKDAKVRVHGLSRPGIVREWNGRPRVVHGAIRGDVVIRVSGLPQDYPENKRLRLKEPLAADDDNEERHLTVIPEDELRAAMRKHRLPPFEPLD